MNSMAMLYRNNSNAMNGTVATPTGFDPRQDALNALQMQMLNGAEMPATPYRMPNPQGATTQTMAFAGPGSTPGDPRTVAARLPYQPPEQQGIIPAGIDTPGREAPAWTRTAGAVNQATQARAANGLPTTPAAVGGANAPNVAPGIGPGGLPTTQLQVGPGSTIDRPSTYGGAAGAGFGSTYGGLPRMPLAGGIPADQPQPGVFPAASPRVPTLTPPWRSRLAVG